MNPTIAEQATNQAVRFSIQFSFMNPTIAKQATKQAVRFPTQFFFMKLMTAGGKSLEKNPVYEWVAGAVQLTMPQSTTKTCMQGEEACFGIINVCQSECDCRVGKEIRKLGNAKRPRLILADSPPDIKEVENLRTLKGLLWHPRGLTGVVPLSVPV